MTITSGPSCQASQPNPALRRKIAEELFGACDWRNESTAFIVCPGVDLHTTGNGRKDCRLTVAGAPWLYCFHANCQDTVDKANYALQRLIGAGERGTGVDIRDLQRCPTHRRPEDVARRAIEAEARRELPRVLSEFPWPACEIFEASPDPLPERPTDNWRAFLGLFAPEDVVWVGEKINSGHKRNLPCFRTARDWLARLASLSPCQFTCGSVFQPGGFSRSDGAVKHRRFLIVESDRPDIDKDAFGAIIRWLREEHGLALAAVVDTAGKSLHAWFRFPGSVPTEMLRIVLPAMGCDPKMFSASQPARLPGANRRDKEGNQTGNFQTLLYLDNSAGYDESKGGVL
jgi:hypothetical protein